jgi:thioredoxin-like negative regulator of GroEL
VQSAAEKALAGAKAASLPVLLNFHSTKCIPCIEIEKVIKEVEPEYAGRVAFVVVDVYEPSEQDLCNQYQIQTIPTTAFLDAGGNFVKGYTGVIDADSMRGILDDLISGIH